MLNPRVEDDDGYSAFVMEFVEGGDLHRYLRRTFNRNAFLELMISVGEGVAACHAKGIIHRDLKPSNILLTSSEDPKISDFDLVKVADTTGGTRTGAMGTFVYAAPECMKKGKEADERADVFSLTMMFVAGLLRDIEELDLSFVYNPTQLNELPIEKSLQEFLARGISLKPSERPTNASIWTEELRGIIKPKPPKKKSSDLWVPGKDTQLSIGGVAFKMTWIEPGTFWMGSPDDDEEAFNREKPRHKVTLTEGFWMAETPCTQALWEAMTGNENPSRFQGAQNPVENVSWDDIQAVLKALNGRQSNLGLRLPTEAEWEYACRAGTQTPRYGKLDEVAWYDRNSNGMTHLVGQKPPNPWGLYDTLGNVWEWCQDWYGPYSKTPVVNPLGPEEGVYRVLRGGSWSDPAQCVRAAYRYGYDPADGVSSYGLRLSRGRGVPSQSGARTAESASKGLQSTGGGPGSKRGTSATKVPDPGVKTAPPSRIETLTHPFEVGLDISQKPTWAESIEKNEWGVWATIRIEPASVSSFWRRPVLFRMRWCPPGEFWMGSSDGDKEARDYEKPRHQVTLTEGFWIAETPCTQALWLAMTGKNPSRFQGAQNPVENISWSMIQTALEALNKRQPTLGLRLPTEAEWEYACRAGTQTPRYGKLDEVAWYRGNSNRTTHHPVGQKTPNSWGLYDTLGNVWEWCQDGDRSYSKTPVVNPLGPKEGVYRVLRGGGWGNPALYVRATYRRYGVPAYGDSLYGLRLSRGHGAPSQSGARRA